MSTTDQPPYNVEEVEGCIRITIPDVSRMTRGTLEDLFNGLVYCGTVTGHSNGPCTVFHVLPKEEYRRVAFTRVASLVSAAFASCSRSTSWKSL